MADQLAAAIAVTSESLDTHVAWATYRRLGFHDSPGAGDLAHHERCATEYEHVLAMLQSHPDYLEPL